MTESLDMATTPALDDVLIYARPTEQKSGAEKTATFQVGPNVFVSRDAAVASAAPAARRRGVAVWLVRPGEPAELIQSYRPTERR